VERKVATKSKERYGHSTISDQELAGLTLTVEQKRKQLLAERSRDPAVLVDLPQTPRAEEYEIATVTNPGGLGKAGVSGSTGQSTGTKS
jgi:hypothetical protein